MISFSYSFEDPEDGELVFAAFSETCRQLKSTLKNKRAKKVAPVAEAPVQVDLEDAIAEAPVEPAPVKKQRAKRGPARAPNGEALSTEAAPEAKLEPVVVRPTAKQPAAARVPVTIADCKSLVTANKDTPDCYTLVAKVLKKHKVAGISKAPEDKAAAIHADLTAAFLGDEIAF